MYGYENPTTPFLDSLTSESFVVPQAIVAGAPTYYSFPAIFASRMPLALGRDVIGLAPGEETLATTLRDSGYATAAFSAANPYLSSRFGYDQGFDTFRDFLDFGSVDDRDAATTQGIKDSRGAESAPQQSARTTLNQSIKSFSDVVGLGGLYNDLYFRYCMRIAPPPGSMDALRSFPSADILVDEAESWLGSIGARPFFLWLHLMDPHSPYYPPNEAYRAFNGEDVDPDRARYLNEYWKRSDLTASRLRRKKNEVVQLYDAGIRWMDIQVARLIASLRRTRQWGDTVFALTADHGEEFIEHGGRYHAPLNLGEEIVHVPLMIRVPGEQSKKVADSPMSHLHLAPTLMEIMGVKAPKTFQGRSLWTNLQEGNSWNDPAIIECAYDCKNPFRTDGRIASRLLGIRESRFKLVMRIESGATERVFDLERDPYELHGLAGSASPATKGMLLAARKHLANSLSGRNQNLRLQARLRDLRYQTLESPSSARIVQHKN